MQFQESFGALFEDGNIILTQGGDPINLFLNK
jgi:hypothetical protein